MKVKLLSAHNPDEVGFGGKHVHLKLLREGLRDAGCEVESCFLPIQKARLRKWERWLIPRKNVAGRAIRFYQRMSGYFKGVSAQPGQVINAHDSLSALWVKGPLVLTLHGYLGRETMNYNRYTPQEARKIEGYLNHVEAQALKKAQAVICVDSRIQDYVVQEYGYPKSQTHVIYNAIDTDRFCPVSSQEQAQLKAQYGFGPQEFVLLCPRRLVRKNGVGVAVQAMAHLKDTPCTLVIVGSGPEQKNLEALMAQINARIQIIPAVDHQKVADYYRLADAILVPSITDDGVQEATSLTMLEGMACAKPVFCSYIGGMAEVLDGKDIGYGVPEQNPEALAQAIRFVLENPDHGQAQGQRARAYVLEHHDYRAHAKAFMSVYQSVLTAGARV